MSEFTFTDLGSPVSSLVDELFRNDFIEIDGSVTRNPFTGNPVGELIGLAARNTISGEEVNLYQDPEGKHFYSKNSIDAKASDLPVNLTPKSISGYIDTSAVPGADNANITGYLSRSGDDDSVLRFYPLAGSDGVVIDPISGRRVAPSDPEYAAIAIKLADSQAIDFGLEVGDTEITSFSFIGKANYLYAPILTNQRSGDHFFAFAEANSDRLTHFASLGPNCWGIEDLLGGGDNDFDDTIVSFNVSPLDGRTPLKQFLEGFPEDLKGRAKDADLLTLLQGRDEAVYFSAQSSDFFKSTTTLSGLAPEELETSFDSRIGGVVAKLGDDTYATLESYLQNPLNYAQGFIAIKDGDIVYEKYPGMNPEDKHVWFSVAKTTASLVIDLLIQDGLIDENKVLKSYIKDFNNTDSGNVIVKNILDMSTGLDTNELRGGRDSDESIVTRLFLSELNLVNNPSSEETRDVLKDAVKDPGNQQGKSFTYSSASTQLLVLLAEEVTGKKWADILHEWVWSKLEVDSQLLVHLSNVDKMAAAHGFVSSRLIDLARFGMLYTQSWDEVSEEEIIDDNIIDSIYNGTRDYNFFHAGDGKGMLENFDDPDRNEVRGNSRQWDVVWNDGDFWKSGVFGQGLYVSPTKDLVIAYYSINEESDLSRFLRPIAKLFS